MGSACSGCTDTSDAEDKKRNNRLLANTQDPYRSGSGSETEGQQTDNEHPTFRLDKVETLFEDLAKFIRDLPEKSKTHIWGHSVKSKQNGQKVVGDTANDEAQITKLLTDLVIVYVKYLDRNQKPLGTRQVKPYVEPAAKWMFETYGPLERTKFISDKQYFATMLEKYQQRSAS